MLVENQLEIIRHHCATLLEKVRLHPDHFVNIVAELAIPDARSYDAQRLKAMSKIFGNGKQQFDTMLKGVDVIYGECTAQTASRKDSIVQPTGDPLKLTVLLRNATPGFKAAVNAMATLHIRESANGLLKEDRNNPEIVILTFRPMCKGLYRIIEKCLLKSKAQDTLNKPIDCSKVKDAAGCFISCTNFKTMHDVMNAIYNNDQWKVCELKNTWTGLSKAGWRDYKVIVQFGGLLFEIQIALEHMVRARNFLDGHAAYAAFRNYYECIKYLGGHEERLTNAVSPDTSAKVFSIDPQLPRDEKLHIVRQQLNAFYETAYTMEEDGMVEEITALHDYVAALHSPDFKNDNSLLQYSQQTSV